MKFLHDFARHLIIIITMMPFLVTGYYNTPKFLTYGETLYGKTEVPRRQMPSRQRENNWYS